MQLVSQVAAFLKQCQSPDGGFGGGPMQLAHLAPTYAAVSAIMVAGREVAYKVRVILLARRPSCTEGCEVVLLRGGQGKKPIQGQIYSEPFCWAFATA